MCPFSRPSSFCIPLFLSPPLPHPLILLSPLPSSLTLFGVAEAELEDVSVGLSVFLLGFVGDDNEGVIGQTDDVRGSFPVLEAQ